MEQKNETRIDKTKKKSSVPIVNISLKTEPEGSSQFSGFYLPSVNCTKICNYRFIRNAKPKKLSRFYTIDNFYSKKETSFLIHYATILEFYLSNTMF
jgi:hypothetical protein